MLVDFALSEFDLLRHSEHHIRNHKPRNPSSQLVRFDCAWTQRSEQQITQSTRSIELIEIRLDVAWLCFEFDLNFSKANTSETPNHVIHRFKLIKRVKSIKRDTAWRWFMVCVKFDFYFGIRNTTFGTANHTIHIVKQVKQHKRKVLDTPNKKKKGPTVTWDPKAYKPYEPKLCLMHFYRITVGCCIEEYLWRYV